MGEKVALSAVLFFGALWLGFWSFKRARDALDAAIDGFNYSRCVVAMWFCISLASAGLASGVVTYWLSVYGPGIGRPQERRCMKPIQTMPPACLGQRLTRSKQQRKPFGPP